MRGFQLWINLPAAEKMKPAGYRDIPASDLSVASFPGDVECKLIAGRLMLDGEVIRGPINGEADSMATDPLFVDVTLRPGDEVALPVPAGHNAFVYAYEGDVQVGGQPLERQAAGILGEGTEVTLSAGAQGARVIVLAGRPLGEPVVQYGPFVMNTREQIEQAVDDYRQGRLTDTG